MARARAPQRCVLCREKRDLGLRDRSLGPLPEGTWEVELEAEPGEQESEKYLGICGDCCEDLENDARDAGREFFAIGYVDRPHD